MRSTFRGFYPPTKDEFSVLWATGTIILDTNVLLNMYRLPPEAREEFLRVLDSVKDRLWIPHHVGLEFQRNRMKVIADRRAKIGNVLEKIDSKIEEIQADVLSLQLEKHGINVSAEELLKKFCESASDINGAVKKASELYSDVASGDSIRCRIDEIIGGNIGKGPLSQDELKLLTKDGDARFAKRIPPGFRDESKDRGRDDSSFHYADLEYERKFGDLIIWRQITAHCREHSLKAVLMITADRKDDWWWNQNGKTLGPLPELIEEIGREAKVEVFWMYSAVQFVEHAKQYLQAKISDRSVAELKGVAAARLVERELPNGDGSGFGHWTSATAERVGSELNLAYIEGAVFDWLQSKHMEVRRNTDFPDFVSGEGEGFEFKYVKSFRDMLFPPSVINSMLRGYLEVNTGKLSSFCMIVVAAEEQLDKIYERDSFEELNRRVVQIKERYPVDRLIVGAVIDGQFFPAVDS